LTSAPRPEPGTRSAVVVDDTALVALGAGNQMMSRLVVAAHGAPGRYVYTPAMCLAAAVARRPRLGDHVGSLLAIHVVDLGFDGARAAGVLIAEGADWQHAHAVTAARPSPEWPTGLPVVTAAPDAYAGHDLEVISLT
jgi:hypothetical protein